MPIKLIETLFMTKPRNAAENPVALATPNMENKYTDNPSLTPSPKKVIGSKADRVIKGVARKTIVKDDFSKAPTI